MRLPWRRWRAPTSSTRPPINCDEHPYEERNTSLGNTIRPVRRARCHSQWRADRDLQRRFHGHHHHQQLVLFRRRVPDGRNVVSRGESRAWCLPARRCSSSYYSLASSADPYLVGGYSGYLGSSTPPSSISAQVPDPVITQSDGTKVGYGALRFTNGSVVIGGSYKYGFNERGAILSTSTFPTGAGIQVTFKTVTYHGNSGGAGGDGADGISFFLQDGAQAPGLGAFGGSLAYSCSNNNTPHDGLTGGYIGLGIDEYGNFLNGTNLVTGYTGPMWRAATTRPTVTATSRAASDCAAPAAYRLRRSLQPMAQIPAARACRIIRSRSRHPAPTQGVSTTRPAATASTFAPQDRRMTPPRASATRHAPAAPFTAAAPTPATPARPVPTTALRSSA